MKTLGHVSKLLSHSWQLPLKVAVLGVRLVPRRKNKYILTTTELLVASYGMVCIVIGIALYFTDREMFFHYTREDGIVEYSTALFLLASFLICAARAYRARSKPPLAFYLLAALAFFFGFGEEMSWGQRLFHFATPEELMKINVQKELTLHNIEVYGISFKKVLFRLVLNSCVLFYFLGFPILSATKAWFRNLTVKYSVPIPTPVQGLLFLILSLSALVIDEGKKWELVELAISCLVFLAFLFPSERWRLLAKQPVVSQSGERTS